MKMRPHTVVRVLLAVLVCAMLAIASQARAQTTWQFETTPWGAYAPARIQCGSLIDANMNVTTDQGIPISVPSATYVVDSIQIGNPSISLTSAQGGFYSAASKGGVAIVASTQAYSTLTTNAANATGNVMTATLAAAGTTTAFGGFAQGSTRIGTIYFSLTTAQGAAATADIRVYCVPRY